MKIKKYTCGFCKLVTTRQGLRKHLANEHIKGRNITNINQTDSHGKKSDRVLIPTEKTKQTWWITEEWN